MNSLLDHGHTVVEVVRSGRRAGAQTPSVLEFDLQSPPKDTFRALGRPDALIHLAWGGLPNYSSPHHVQEQFPLHVKFLSTLAAQGLQRMLVAGTCFEYGLAEGRIKESSPVAPVTEYAQAKVLLHQHLLERASGTEIVWARLFYPYGDGQSANSLYGQFQLACKSGAELFPMSPGDQLRDYLPVEEMGDLLSRLALTDGIGTRVVNVCSGQPISVRHLVERWAKDCNSNIRLRTGVYPYPAHEPRNAWGDRSLLDALLRGQRDSGR